MIQLFNLGPYLNINDCEGRIFWGTLMREIQTHIIYIRINIKNSLDTAISKRDYYKSKRDYEESNPEIVYVKWWWED